MKFDRVTSAAALGALAVVNGEAAATTTKTRFLQRAAKELQHLATSKGRHGTGQRRRQRRRRRRNLSMQTFFHDQQTKTIDNKLSPVPQKSHQKELIPCTPPAQPKKEADVGILDTSMFYHQKQDNNNACEEDGMTCEFSEEANGYFCVVANQEETEIDPRQRQRYLEQDFFQEGEKYSGDEEYDYNIEGSCNYSDDYDFDSYTGTSTCFYDRGCGLYVDGYCHSLEIQYVVEDGYDLALSFCYTFHPQHEDISVESTLCIGIANYVGTCAVKVDRHQCNACFLTPPEDPDADDDDASPCVSIIS
jgi:hypothetical protein